ncbi:hypothetical protein [Paeniglutamicibacter sp. Y32M11]|uniref:hypothetical protein n=1 Tax=Paeniglutamicibacter sp. Y32M11 TaxID=2853258 RepID=UPI001C53086A|nr:hypothetical protein [Paeniglutamicibacter sp. Y32M11]QXQ09841.1 hypothetical protein KUF55_15540 [Paeniglutamicibacter sp. Y32M11]
MLSVDVVVEGGAGCGGVIGGADDTLLAGAWVVFGAVGVFAGSGVEGVGEGAVVSGVEGAVVVAGAGEVLLLGASSTGVSVTGVGFEGGGVLGAAGAVVVFGEGTVLLGVLLDSGLGVRVLLGLELVVVIGSTAGSAAHPDSVNKRQAAPMPEGPNRVHRKRIIAAPLSTDDRVQHALQLLPR